MSIRSALARITGFFTGSRHDAELSEELESHLAMATAENIRRGMSPEEARRQALAASGGLTQAAEAVRDRRGLPWIDHLFADVRYAMRTLRRAPTFTTVAIITLGLGIGANTAIFSVVSAVLLKSVPQREGDRLVYLRQTVDGPTGQDIAFSVPEIRDFRTGMHSLSGIAEYSPWADILQEDDGARTVQIGLVTGNFFDIMGLAPVRGRLTRPSDDGPGVPPVVVLTWEFWMKHYGGDTSIVGRPIRMRGGATTVIGVVQPAPWINGPVDMLGNMVISPHHLSATMVEGRTHRMTQMVGRLTESATLDQTRSEAANTYTRMTNEHREFYDPAAHGHVEVIPFKEMLGERARLTLWLLMASATFVLIISAANVANLTLMRGVGREQELVVRSALGAGTARLRRLLVAENMVLSLVGAVIGIALASLGVKLLIALAARYSPRSGEIKLDLPVLAFTLGLSIGLALLLSFVASLPKEGTFGSWISAGMRSVGGGLKKHRLQRALVAVQVAVSVVLLSGAGLLTRTLIQLSDVSTGLATEDVLTIPLPLTIPKGPDASAQTRTSYERMQREIAALPGVITVGIGSTMPLKNSGITLDLKAEGKVPAPNEPIPSGDWRTASPEYFRAAGIPLIKGRFFDETDREGSPKVVIINQTLADKFFPGEDPLGKRIAWTGDVLRFTPVTGDWRTIVGVVGNTQDDGPDQVHRAVVFHPFEQEVPFMGGLVIRADHSRDMAAAATRIVRRIAPETPIENVLTVSEIKDRSIAPRRLNAALISSFSVLALIIAAVGIAGVLAFSVSSRTAEIGVRMSLGADSGMVQRMILWEGGALLLMGLVLGLLGAWPAAGVLRGLLFGVAPHDPITLVSVAAAMCAIGLAACWIPARRASRIDPAISMRGL